MTFDQLIEKAWNDHASDPAGVAARLPEALSSIQSPDDLAAFCHLAQHVYGEHLGRWADGSRLLLDLVKSPHFVASGNGKALYRSLAVLSHCGDDEAEALRYFELSRSAGAHLAQTEASDKIRYLAAVAATLAGQARTGEAAAAFQEALALAAYEPGRSDPASRALAVTGNNLAVQLEEQATRTLDEVLLMKVAAKTARTYWEVAGGWLEVERAEYRLAMTMLAVGEPEAALYHALKCYETCVANAAAPFELVFAHQALAKAHRAMAIASAAKVAPEHRDYALKSAHT